MTSSSEDEEIEAVTFDGDRWGGGTSSKANTRNNNQGAVLFYRDIQMPMAWKKKLLLLNTDKLSLEDSTTKRNQLL